MTHPILADFRIYQSLYKMMLKRTKTHYFNVRFKMLPLATTERRKKYKMFFSKVKINHSESPLIENKIKTIIFMKAIDGIYRKLFKGNGKFKSQQKSKRIALYRNVQH